MALFSFLFFCEPVCNPKVRVGQHHNGEQSVGRDHGNNNHDAEERQRHLHEKGHDPRHHFIKRHQILPNKKNERERMRE